MASKLALLLIGSSTEIHQEIERILREGPHEATITRVPDLQGFRSALQTADGPDAFDLILCESETTPSCIAESLKIIEASGRDTPLLVISESDDTQAAVDAIRAGAHDWIITHHLQQCLPVAIDLALNDLQHRREAAQVAAALEQSRKRYHDLAEALPQVVFEMDRKGHFTFVNDQGLAILGYTREDLANAPHVSTVIAEEDRPRAVDRVTRLLNGEKFEAGAEYTVLRADGTRIPALIYSAPIMEDGEIVGLRGVLIDLHDIRETEQQLRRSEERYRQLVEAMGDGLVTIKRDGTITYANQALADMVEMPLERISGHNAAELLDEENAAIMRGQLERRFTEAVSDVYELEVSTATSGRITLLVSSTPLYDEAGNVTASLAVITDITQQRRVQNDLLRIKTAVDNSSDAIGMADADLVPIYLNPTFVSMFGYTAEELAKAGGPRANFVDEDEYHRVFAELGEIDSFAGEFEGRHRSGRTFPVMGRIDVVRDDRGELTGYVAVFSDITDRRRREERRRLVNARLALINRLNEMLNAGESIDEIIAAGADGLRDLLEANHVHIFLRRPGEPRDELVLQYSNMSPESEKDVFELPHDPHLVIPLQPGTQPWEVYETGEMVEVSGEDLAQTVADIEALIDASPRYQGLAITERLGIRYLALTPLTRAGETIGHVAVSRAEEIPFTDMERALLEGFANQMAVILDKARTEREVARLNQFLEGIIDNAAVWFSVLDEDQKVIIWNHAAEQITGYSRDDIASGSHLMRLLYPDDDDRRQAYDYLDRAFEGEELRDIETSVTCADGSERRIAWHLRRFSTTTGGTGLVIIGRDVSESHELHEQLQRVQRMDAVGTLAGGIAHDFNNVLTAIIGYADLMATEADEGSSARWHAAQIAQNAKRASRLTRQLLAFSRKQPSRPQVVDLNRLVRDMVEMLRRVTPEDIDLHLDLSTDLGYTEIDPSQLEQILMNLVLNARDAMPAGGEVRITTGNAVLSDDSLNELFDAAPGQYVSLQVADTGIGMDEETESRIFEPFFTTKAARGGTGLGLSTVYGLVRQNKGVINVYSEVGRGTIFRVYLPRVDQASFSDSKAVREQYSELAGSETMLVVEDADNLRDLIGTILTSFGYTVYTAGEGTEALKLEEAHRDEIDLVITDVVMPEMSGTELADELLKVSPDLKILFISGYPTERAISAERTDGRYSFLQKPFSAVELGQKIREMLDRN